MSNMPATPAAAPAGALPGVMQLLTGAKDLIMKRLGYFVALVLVADFLIPIVAFGIVAAVVGGGALVLGFYHSTPVMVLLVLLALALVIAAIFVKVVLMLAPMFAVSDESMTSIKKAIMDAKPKAGAAFVTMLMVGILVAVGFALLIIPGIYLAIALGFSLWAVALDGKSGSDALKYSNELVKGRWWGVFGRMAAMGIAAWLVLVIPNSIFQNLGLDFLAGLYSIIIALFITPFATAYSYLLYKALKENRPAGAPMTA